MKEFPVDLRRTDKRAKSPPKSLIHGVSTYFGLFGARWVRFEKRASPWFGGPRRLTILGNARLSDLKPSVWNRTRSVQQITKTGVSERS
jgi:hypothetical protein